MPLEAPVTIANGREEFMMRSMRVTMGRVCAGSRLRLISGASRRKSARPYVASESARRFDADQSRESTLQRQHLGIARASHDVHGDFAVVTMQQQVDAR